MYCTFSRISCIDSLNDALNANSQSITFDLIVLDRVCVCVCRALADLARDKQTQTPRYLKQHGSARLGRIRPRWL